MGVEVPKDNVVVALKEVCKRRVVVCLTRGGRGKVEVGDGGAAFRGGDSNRDGLEMRILWKWMG